MVDQICWAISYQYNAFPNFNWGLKLEKEIVVVFCISLRKNKYTNFMKSHCSKQ